MAVTLTTNWQPVASGSFIPGTGFNVSFYLDAKYSTQSQANNTTTIQTRLNCVVNSGYGSGYNYGFTCSYAPTVSGSGLWTLKNETITSGESIITHNQDGTKSLTLSASARVNGIGMNLSFSGDVIIPRIDRYPLITSAPDFSDEDDPTITYTTVLGFEGATVEAGIFDSTGTTPYVSYREVNVENGSYTFELTNEERNILRNATPNSNTLNVMFKLRTTTTNNVEYFSTSVKQLRIVNAYPTFTNVEEETNAKVITLLGTSGNTVIQNASVLRTTITPTTYKGASMSWVRVISQDYFQEKTTSPYEFDIPIKSGSFTILVNDTRGNGHSEIITKTLIEYQPVDITNLSMKRANPTSSNIVLNLEATYYQKTFGSTANVPVVKWKLDDGSYTTIPSTEYTIDTTNNKLTISNYTLFNVLDYRNPGAFIISIEDLLTSDTNARNVTKGIPTFDAGEHDLKVNGKIYLADEDGQNPVEVGQGGDTLPIGSIIPYGNANAPSNWLVCDGSAISRTTYSELFNVIGTTYGSGDGSTTFNLPDLRGKVAVGQNSSDTDFDTLGETGGSKTHTHRYGMQYGGYYRNTSLENGPSSLVGLLNYSNESNYTLTGGGNVVGNGSMEVNNTPNSTTATPTIFKMDANVSYSKTLQPYQIVCYIIKVQHTSYAGNIPTIQTSYSDSNTDVYCCNYVNNYVKVDNVSISVGVINAGGEKYDQDYTLTIPSGYVFAGILGYGLSGTNHTLCYLSKLMKNGDNKIRWTVRNTSSSIATASLTLTVNVLFIKKEV